MKLITYQDPKMFKWAGFFLNIWGKRYCIFKMGSAWANLKKETEENR